MGNYESTHVLTQHLRVSGHSQVIDAAFTPGLDEVCGYSVAGGSPSWAYADYSWQTGELPADHSAMQYPAIGLAFLAYDSVDHGQPADHRLMPLYPVADEEGWTYDDAAVNALYNVKTWRVEMSCGAFSVDETVEAGQFVSASPAGATVLRGVPNGGDRGVYGFNFSFSGSEGDEYLSFSIAFLPASFGAGAERLSGHEDSPFAAAPRVYVDVRYNDGEGDKYAWCGHAMDLGSPYGEPAETDATVGFLGEEIPVYSDDPPDFALEVTPDTWWTTEPWYTGP